MSDLSKSNSFYVKKYAVLFEERDRAKDEHSKGNAELGAHLNEFRKKLDNTSTSQVERFDQEFFSQPEDEALESPDSQKNAIEDQRDATSEVKKTHPEWIKKVYKKIVFSTHPDKIGSFPIKEVVKKYTRLYQIAVASYEKEKYSDVMMVAGELDIPLPESKINEHIIPAIEDLTIEIESLKSTMGFQWYHVEEHKRETVLTNYLKQLGYTFTAKQVKDVVSRKNNRKIGNRPVKRGNRRLE